MISFVFCDAVSMLLEIQVSADIHNMRKCLEIHFQCFLGLFNFPQIQFNSVLLLSQCAYCEVSLDTLGKKFKDPEKCLIGFRVLRYDG